MGKEKAMKQHHIILAGAAILALTAGTALAQHGSYGGYVEYRGYHEYSGVDGYRSPLIDRYRGAPHYDRYPSFVGRGSWYGPGAGETHAQAVRRIMARYSRDRYYTHPRSPYNEPVRFYHYPW
jgi:hypothetical protein